MSATPTPPPAPAPASANGGLGQSLDLIDAVIYADVFDCAVTTDELWRFSRAPISWDDFWRQLEGDPALAGALRVRDGLCCLAGREHLLELRPGRRRRALELRRRARRVARVLQHLPFVRGLLLTGSAGADDAERDADVDLLVLVQPGRLSTAFTILGGLSRLLSRSLFCPNHYLSRAQLELRRRDLYIAREVLQAYPLAGEADALRAANDWVAALLPNATTRTARVRPLPGGALLQRLLEWPLRGRLGDALEGFLQPLALSRLEAHHGAASSTAPEDVVDDLRSGVQLRFHASPHNQAVLARYESRRDEVAARLLEGP
jgi:predicted nucleotidyltransferase